MEQTMYEDGDNRTNSTPLKPSFILDFNQQTRSRPQMDLGLLKLTSPELERYLIQQEGSVVTAVTPTTQILFPKCVTQEQENYARGFIDALDELHRRQGIPSHVIKKEKNDDDDDDNFYHNINNNVNNEINLTDKYNHNNHLHFNNVNNNNHNTDNLNEISHNNGLYFINNNNNRSHDNDDTTINSFNNKTHTLNTLHNINNNNFIIINNNNNKLSSTSSQLHNMPSLLALSNNNNKNVDMSQLSQTTSLSTNLSTLSVISLNYNLANNIKNNNVDQNNILLTNPDISLNENIFSKQIPSNLSPLYSILPPAQTLLTRSPTTKSLHPSTPQPLLDTKPYISTASNNNHQLKQQQDPNKSIHNKTPQKRVIDMTKFNPHHHFSHLSPTSLKNVTDELTNQTVPHLLSSPPSISSTAGSPLSNSPSEEIDRLEIKRARNRLAAQKCRSRKLERIAVLSQRVDELRQQNVALEVLRTGVVNSIDKLQQQLQQHSQCNKPLSITNDWNIEALNEDV